MDAETREALAIIMAVASNTAPKEPDWLHDAFEEQVRNIRRRKPVDPEWRTRALATEASYRFDRLLEDFPGARDVIEARLASGIAG